MCKNKQLRLLSTWIWDGLFNNGKQIQMYLWNNIAKESDIKSLLFPVRVQWWSMKVVAYGRGGPLEICLKFLRRFGWWRIWITKSSTSVHSTRSRRFMVESFALGRGAEQRQIWQIVLYCDRIRCYAAKMWQKLKCYACFILPKLIKNRLTDQWYWSRIGKVAAYPVKQ